MRRTLAIVIVFFSSCDVHDDRLQVVNMSGQEIALQTEKDTIPKYPNVNKSAYYLGERLLPGESVKLKYEGMRNGWSFFIKESVNKRLNLFVYDIDSLKKYRSIDTLTKRHLYTRYSFSEGELENKNWRVLIND